MLLFAFIVLVLAVYAVALFFCLRGERQWFRQRIRAERRRFRRENKALVKIVADLKDIVERQQGEIKAIRLLINTTGKPTAAVPPPASPMASSQQRAAREIQQRMVVGVGDEQVVVPTPAKV